MPASSACTSGSCVAWKALAIVLVAAAVGVADTFVVRRFSVSVDRSGPAPEIPAVTPPEQPVPQPQPQAPVATTAPQQPVTPAPEPARAAPAALPAGMITLEQAIALFGRMMSAGDVQFVDARNAEDFAKGRIPAALLLPPTKFGSVIPPEVDQLVRGNTIVIYCGGGECDASKLTELRLHEMGFTKTLIFHDGFPAWEKAGQPVER